MRYEGHARKNFQKIFRAYEDEKIFTEIKLKRGDKRKKKLEN